jgi:hypothetical protein
VWSLISSSTTPLAGAEFNAIEHLWQHITHEELPMRCFSDALKKARLGWALNVTMPCTPMLFMGTEVHHHSYWCPDTDAYGDHRFNWDLARDDIGAAGLVRCGDQ